jgi:hypothetical protein
MSKKLLSNTNVILIFCIFIFTLNCSNQKNELNATNKTSEPVQNLTGEEISRLDNGKIVRFPATIVINSETDCVEIFAQDDFKKYNGDGKHAIFSRFASEPNSSDWFSRSKKAIVTGKMILIKNAIDTSKTCGIYTGQLFEITEIEYF